MIRTPGLLALLVAVALSSTPATAQVATDNRPAPALPPGINSQEFQGLSCLVGGGVAAVGGWAYGEIVITAAAAGASAPLLVPIVATAFVAGCGVGSVLSPGLLWIYRQLP